MTTFDDLQAQYDSALPAYYDEEEDAPDHDCLLPPGVCGGRDPMSSFFGYTPPGVDDTIWCDNAPPRESPEPDCRTCSAIGALCDAHASEE